MLFSNWNVCIAQNLPDPNLPINRELRRVFYPFTMYSVQPAFLDMGVKMVDSLHINGDSTVETNPRLWYAGYRQMRACMFDTNSLPKVETIIARAQKSKVDTIPLLIFKSRYMAFRPNRFDSVSNSYFNLDSNTQKISVQNGVVFDSVFENGISFMATLAHYKLNSSKRFVLKVSKDFIFGEQSFYSDLANQTAKINVKCGDNEYLDVTSFYGTGTEMYYTFDLSGSTETVIKFQVEYQSTALSNIPNSAYRYSQNGFRVAAVNATSTTERISSYSQTDAFNIGYAAACKEVNVRRALIYVEGIDLLDVVPSMNRDVDTIYKYMVKEPFSNLRNYGYDIYVLDWKNSRLDMRVNAMSLVNYIQNLQGQYSEPLVVVGESMGGVIARYALTYMESKNIEHHVRYLLTIDSPHRGASIPLSLQAAYRRGIEFMSAFTNVNDVLATFNLQGLNRLLDEPAVRQLLIHHIDYPISNTYKYRRHPAADEFWSELYAMGNYPKNCKKVALSNGSLHGYAIRNRELQTNRTPSDKLIDLSFTENVTLFWCKIPLSGVSAFLATNKPDQDGTEILRVGRGAYIPHIRITWRGIKFMTDYIPVYSYSKYASAPEYCTIGSSKMYTGIDKPKVPYDGNYFNFLGLVQASYFLNSDSTQRCFIQANGGFSLFSGLIGASIEGNVCSDGFDFGFIPVGSAFDDDRGTEDMIGHDYFNESLASKLGNTPFDAIVGANTFPERGNDPARRADMCRTGDDHLSIRDNVAREGSCKDPLLKDGFWMADIGANDVFLNNVNFNYSTSITAINTLKGDKIMETNVTQAQNYEMEWQYSSAQPNYGCYTKTRNATTSGGGLVTLYISPEVLNAIPRNFNTPADGGFTIEAADITTCCFAYDRARIAAYPKTLPDVAFAAQIVNPILHNEVQVSHNQLNKAINYKVYNLQGKLLAEKTSNASPEEKIELPASLASGTYLLRITLPDFSSHSYTLVK